MPLATTVTLVVDGACALAYIVVCVVTEISQPTADHVPCGQDFAAAIFTCVLVLGAFAGMFGMRYVTRDLGASWECWRWKREMIGVDLLVQLALLVTISLLVLLGTLCLRVELWVAYMGFTLAHMMSQVCISKYRHEKKNILYARQVVCLVRERHHLVLTSPSPPLSEAAAAAWAEFVLHGPPKPSARLCLSCFLAAHDGREHCVVCLNELAVAPTDDTLDIPVYLCLKCMHAVHARCMHGWHIHQGAQRGSCPTCRETACGANHMALNRVCQCLHGGANDDGGGAVCDLPPSLEQQRLSSLSEQRPCSGQAPSLAQESCLSNERSSAQEPCSTREACSGQKPSSGGNDAFVVQEPSSSKHRQEQDSQPQPERIVDIA